MTAARYDGHADWYDEFFATYADGTRSSGLLGRLLGRADPHDPVCLDVGCGTGLHLGAVSARGYTVVGVDLSSDQLRIARTRNRAVVRADAARLPLPDSCVPAVVMTFTHTDLDDFAGAIGEAARVLRLGGRLVYLGLHPSYVGGFADRSREVEQGALRLAPGYGDETLHRSDSERFPVRHRVGARNLTLATFLGPFLAHDRLRIESVSEYDTNLRPWRVGPSDDRVVPWNIAVLARAIA